MKKVWILVLFATLALGAQAQMGYYQEGEYGISLGAGHYFGDLNTRAKLNRPKLAGGIFFKKNFGNYIALRVNANYARLGYSDVYNDHNALMKRRNLSFNSNVYEFGVAGEFNFFRFMPGDPEFRFTPFVSLGVSVFNYNPFAYLNGRKVNLRELGTEGQNVDSLGRKAYSSMALAIPFGVGFKYALNERMNIGFEITHRFTRTDYLDDVSTTFADPLIFPPSPDGSPTDAFLLQDRSYETGTRIGSKGVQRGNSKQKDQFATAVFFVSFNLQSYKCPKY